MIYLTPPAEWLQPSTPIIRFKVTTNADVIDYANRFESLLQQCDLDKQSIKQWAAENGSQSNGTQ